MDSLCVTLFLVRCVQLRLATRQQVQDMRDYLTAEVAVLSSLEEEVIGLQQVCRGWRRTAQATFAGHIPPQ